MVPTAVRKRDGSQVPFERDRIRNAIAKAQLAIAHDDEDLAEELTDAVLEQIGQTVGEIVDLEDIQDAVVLVLQGSVNYELAQAYIRYRDSRERERRLRRSRNEDEPSRPNLWVMTAKGARRQWTRNRLERFLCRDYAVSQKVADDVACRVEAMLAETNVDEIGVPLLMSLVDAALLQCGCHALAEEKSPLRISRELVARMLDSDWYDHGITAAGRAVLRQWSLSSAFGRDVLRLYADGRLWVDGIDDPMRGSQYMFTVDGRSDPWRLMTEAFALVGELRHAWQRIDIVMPPMMLGQLERGDEELARALDRLGEQAAVYLYCDGRTPLLDSWPLANKQVGIATYADDFLLQGRLQELGLSMLSGPHLMQPSWRRRVAVRLALNAQGLEHDHSRMDLLAMGLVSAAKSRLQQLSVNQEVVGAEVRYVIFGLPPNSEPLEYLERQVTQEGLRSGVPLSRSNNLPQGACEHFGKSFRRPH